MKKLFLVVGLIGNILCKGFGAEVDTKPSGAKREFKHNEDKLDYLQ